MSLPLTPLELSIWDVREHRWQVVAGEFGVLVGASSRDIRLRGTLHAMPRGGYGDITQERSSGG